MLFGFDSACASTSACVRLKRRVSELATHDALTRLLDRNGLDDVLRRDFGDSGGRVRRPGGGRRVTVRATR